MNNWIEVSAERLAANFRAIQDAAGPETTVLAVIKANAYGHDAEVCAPILVSAGATWLGVTCADEGARVRESLVRAGLSAEILIMCGFLPEDVPLIQQHALTPVVWTVDQVDWLAAQLGLGSGTRVHLEVDTGMGRQGVPVHEVGRVLGYAHERGLVVDGVFTHLCSAEVANSPVTALQKNRFEEAFVAIRALACKPTWIHAANSSGIDNPANDFSWLGDLTAEIGARLMVRTGLALYGYTQPVENAAALPSLRPALEPVLTWKARVLAVRDLAPGETVGYNATFTATVPMRIALLPAGYADGLRRELSSTNSTPGGWAMIQGKAAPILGRISMNLTVVDVTEHNLVRAGDEAILLGDGITADDHAALAHTIAYEIVCGIHPCG